MNANQPLAPPLTSSEFYSRSGDVEAQVSRIWSSLMSELSTLTEVRKDFAGLNAVIKSLGLDSRYFDLVWFGWSESAPGKKASDVLYTLEAIASETADVLESLKPLEPGPCEESL